MKEKTKKALSYAKNDSDSKRPGGITGRGFMPGRSGNPNGRPQKLVTILSDALRDELAEVDETTKPTYAQVIARRVIRTLASGKRLDHTAVAAIAQIGDRTEGKPTQKVSIQQGKPLENRTIEELKFYSEHEHWPDEALEKRE